MATSPHQAPLRRVKSHSNLKRDETNTSQKAYPEDAEDVNNWVKRRNSVDTELNVRDFRAEDIFELPDTSPALLPPKNPPHCDSNLAYEKFKYIYK